MARDLSLANAGYGVAHSRFYKPSIVSRLLGERDSKGEMQVIRTDAYLLLRQNNLEKQIGVESLRRYFDSLRGSFDFVDTSRLSDDELFSLIPPKGVNNLTTAQEYAEFLQAKSEEVISHGKEYVKKHNRMIKYFSGDRNKKNEPPKNE